MKPKISVLMNCYNGEAYLREALDSVFSQKFNDWELVFVDNCSTDKSAEILYSYNQERIRYFKTTENIPLGAARNFGVERCSGEYIAFLDTDDVYHDFALEKLYKMVSENHYALAYGGHSNMNSSGNYIGVFQPDKREGYLFPELLVNFNIPIVGSIVSKKILIDSELTFDPQISASEEYCLFMQLAANYHIVSTDTLLLKYRVHDDSLTNRTIAKWGEERRYTLSKILASKPELKGRYPSQFNAAYARAAYYDAQYKMHLKEPKQAQLLLSEYKFFNITYFLLYLVSYMPPLVWNLIQRWKYKRVNFS